MPYCSQIISRIKYLLFSKGRFFLACVIIKNNNDISPPSSQQHADFMTSTLKLLDNKMTTAYGTRYDHLIVDYLSVQKYFF